MSPDNGDKRPRFNQLPQGLREAKVAQMQGAVEPKMMFQIELCAYANGQVMVGCPEGMEQTVKGCATISDVLAKGIRVMAARIAGMETEESRILIANPGQVPGLQG